MTKQIAFDLLEWMEGMPKPDYFWQVRISKLLTIMEDNGWIMPVMSYMARRGRVA